MIGLNPQSLANKFLRQKKILSDGFRATFHFPEFKAALSLSTELHVTFWCAANVIK